MKHLFLALGFLLIASACQVKSADVSAQAPRPTPTPVPDTQISAPVMPTPVPDQEIPAKPAPAPEEPIAVPDPKTVPRDQLQTIVMDGGQQLEFLPKVDILFVEDNSDSMKNKQENLFRSINSFAAGFQKNRMIDYHIGVISVWDASDRFAAANKIFGAGDLRFAKDGSGRQLGERFVTRKNNTSGGLAASLKLGVLPYDKGGPENEEIFSPLWQALQKTGRGAANEGFFREDAQLVVVLMTDADDATSNIDAEQMANELVSFKGRADRVSVYAALVSKNDDEELKDWALRIHPNYHPECFDFSGKTPKNNGVCKVGFSPERLERFVVLANAGRGTPEQIRSNFIISITQKDFGKDLTKIGADITRRTLEKEILLDQRPRVDENGNLMIRVRYGTDKQLATKQALLIPFAEKQGWKFDSRHNSIRLSGDIEYDYQDGAHFQVEYTPVLIK